MKTPGRLSLLRKALFSLITCCLFFGLLETLLWAVGIRQLRDVRDPFVGFTPGAPLFTRSGDQFETTDVRRTYFNLQTFAAVKPAGTRRIFCLGGSTTYGHPWDDSTSYPRWLRDMLNAASPDQRWEVVNCGGISYASYRLAWLTDELLQYQPDVLIVHTGHNEFLEDRSWSSFRELSPAVRSFAALAGRLRTTTLLDQVLGGASREKPGKPVLREEVDPLLDRSAGPSVYSRDDDRARMVVQHLEHSLQKICRIGRAAGIPVILVLPGSNLRDFAPFRSDFSQPGFANSLKVTQLLRQADELQQQQQPEQAFSTLQQAVSVDPRYAESAYRAGRLAADLGRCEDALKLLKQARDEDICPLRATQPSLDAIVQVSQQEQVPLVDFASILDQHALQKRGCAVPGDEGFLDHVHPTIDMHRDLAIALGQQLQQLKLLPAEVDFRKLASGIELSITSSLDAPRQAVGLTTVAQVLSWAGKNTEALRIAEQARQLDSQNVEVLSQLGRLYEKVGQMQDARNTLEQAVAAGPDNPWALYRLARLHMRENNWSAALELLERSRQHTTTAQPSAFRSVLFRSLSQCCEQTGDLEKARVYAATAASQ
jgi:tetratricopeptide (TPR) repeat protein